MFIARTAGGAIYGAWTVRQWESQEEVAADNADLVAFEAASRKRIPQVSAGQLIRALDELGLLIAVDAAVIGADAMTQRLWARAAFFQRNDPLVTGIATGLGKTSDELDAIFVLAATK